MKRPVMEKALGILAKVDLFEGIHLRRNLKNWEQTMA